ncbi:MAG: hypothetical protein AAGD96_29710, partial [Chloroflexota bacterium]
LVNSQQMNLSQLRLSFQTFVLVLLTMITSTVVLNLLTDSMVQALDEIQANSAYGVTFSPMVFHWSERLSQILLLIGSGLFVNIHLNRAIRSKQSEPLDLVRRFGMWATIGLLLTMFLLYYSINLFGKFENQILFATLSILAAGFGWQTWQAWASFGSSTVAPIPVENLIINRGLVITTFMELVLLLTGGLSATVYGVVFLFPNPFREQVNGIPITPILGFNILDVALWMIIIIIFVGGYLLWRRFDDRRRSVQQGFQLSSWSNSVLTSDTDTLLPKSMIAIFGMLIFVPISLNLVSLTISAIEPLSKEQFPYPDFDPTWLVDSVLINFRFHIIGSVYFIFSGLVMFATIYVIRRMFLSGRINFLPEGLQGGDL